MAYLPPLSQGSSVSIVSDCRLDDRGSISAGAKDFSSSLCIQPGSGAHPASYPVSTRVLSLGARHSQGMMLTTHPHLVLRSRMSRSCTSSPPQAPSWRVVGQLYYTYLHENLNCYKSNVSAHLDKIYLSYRCRTSLVCPGIFKIMEVIVIN
jgi:hypothetical protein